MERRPTIYDVATQAGVAPSTVSRAYSRPGRVNADTARRVFEAAERIGYRAAPLDGRGMRDRHTTNAVGLVIADVTNPFYGEIIKGAYAATREAGCLLILSDTGGSAEVERETVEGELAHVDGIVIASPLMSDSALRMIAKQRAVVLLNRVLPEVSCVVSDNPRGVKHAAAHLGMLGHSGITYVAGPERSWAEGVRWRALREAGLELQLAIHRTGPHNSPTIRAGFQAAASVVKSGATAVLAFNDQLAIGVIKGVQRLGLRVPDDVSVIGFDNIFVDEIVEPALTTIAAPLYEMGMTGARNCLAVAQGARPNTPSATLPVRLIQRASTGQRSRNNTSPALGTTIVSGSASNVARSTSSGSR